MSPILLPLETVKELLGVTGTEQDAALTQALPVVTEYFEHHCKRGLAYVDPVVEESRIVTVERLPLFRYPVDAVVELAIDEVVLDPVPIPPQLDQARGFIYLNGWGWPYGGGPYYGPGYCWPGGFARVTYSGGYPDDQVPADLADAFARCCADYAGVAYAAAGAGGSSGAGAPLKSLGLGSGALTVSFDTATQLRSSYDTSSVPSLLSPYLYTLEHYRMKDYL